MASRSGTSLRKILDAVKDWRHRTQVPPVVMAYYNTVHAFGEAGFCLRVVEAMVDGLIAPDRPVEEAGPLEEPARRAGWRSSSCWRQPAPRPVAPQWPCDRGGVYSVSLTGITGAKLNNLHEVERKSPGFGA